MALPTFFAAGAVQGGSGALTVPQPASTATNDILLLAIETFDQVVGTTTGFVDVLGSPVSASGNTRLTLRWKRHDGSEPSVTVPDSGDHQVARICAYRGCITTGDPWDAGGSSSGNETTSDTSVSVPGATTTIADCLIAIHVATGFDGAGTSTTEFASWTNGDLGSVTERTDNGQNQGNGGCLGSATGTLAVAGTYGATTCTLTNAGQKAYISLALKPPGGAAGIPHKIFQYDQAALHRAHRW